MRWLVAGHRSQSVGGDRHDGPVTLRNRPECRDEVDPGGADPESGPGPACVDNGAGCKPQVIGLRVELDENRYDYPEVIQAQLDEIGYVPDAGGRLARLLNAESPK